MNTEDKDQVQDDSFNVGGDSVGRDKIVYGDEIHGDKVMGDKYEVNIFQRIVNFFQGYTEAPSALRNRQNMLKLVYNTWIKGVLEKSLHNEVLIELDMQAQPDAVEHPWDMVVQMPGQPDLPLSPGTNILDVFDEANRSLLILGEPGSGKTTMLLELARQLITRAEENPASPIPVVFNLSSWDPKLTFAGWLVDELVTKYYISRKVAQAWVDADELLLLLDGLDEVSVEYREECVKAINDFREDHNMELVVCSRSREYGELSARLRLWSAICLLPLTIEQIDLFFQETGPEFDSLRRALEIDTGLQELAQSPLMLNVFILAYHGLHVRDLEAIDGSEDRRRHLFDTYIERMFTRRGAHQPYSPGQTVRWLALLARKMIAHGQTLFLIERMQPDWLENKRQIRQHRILFGLLQGLLLAVPLGLLISLYFGLHLRLPSGLLAGGLVGLFVMLLMMLASRGSVESESALKPTEKLRWSWGKAKKNLPLGLFLGLFGGLLVGGLFWLLYRPALGVLLGLLAGLFGVLINGLLDGLERVEVEVRAKPGLGIQASLNSILSVGRYVGLLLGVPVGLLAALYFMITGGIIIGLLLGLIFGLFVGLVTMLAIAVTVGFRHYGGLFVISFFALYLLLYRNGLIPWRYVDFLDYAADRIFLHKVGGGYIFVHRLLMEHFASLAPRPELDDEADYVLLREVEKLRERIRETIGAAFRKIPSPLKVGIAVLLGSVILLWVATHPGIYHKPLAFAYAFSANISNDAEKVYQNAIRATELDPDNAFYWNGRCWYGCLSGHADEVMDACERAVLLDPYNGGIRDSRGLARTLTGDYQGAVEDFRFFVEWSKQDDRFERYTPDREKREDWIVELETGRNPFDEGTLKGLLNE